MKEKTLLLVITAILNLIINLFLPSYVFSQTYICNVDKLKTVKLGDYNRSVGELQKCLNGLGFEIKDGVTNFFGKQTQEALKTFYKSLLGINVDGKNFGPKGLNWFKLNYSNFVIKKQQGFLIKATSKDDIKKKLSQSMSYYSPFVVKQKTVFSPLSFTTIEASYDSLSKEESPNRYSETNVQVKGIDEPDIVKNDGQRIYFVNQSTRLLSPYIFATKNQDILIRSKIGVNIIKSFPPEELSLITNIEQNDYANSLLLDKEKNILVIFNNQGIAAYQVSDPSRPQKLWSYNYAKNVDLLDARFYKGKIYLFLRSFLYVDNPCPLPVLTNNNKSYELACTEFYVPVKPIANENSYNVIILNPQSGNIENKVSFIGSFFGSVVYVSPNNIYLTYSYQEDLNKFILDFFYYWLNDILPAEMVTKINKLKNYDISDEGKIYEIENLINKYFLNFNPEKRDKIYQEINKRIEKYLSENIKEIEKTALIKIDINNLEVKNSGYIPGKLLNQFSLDEDNNYLRVAVTLGDQGFGFGSFWARSTSSNAIYILNDKLEIIGSLENLGLTERIYSARFYGNRGYLVTFRQVDPFYVIDLTYPDKPQLKGELKIPGYSSYLEELGENLVLGVGKEDQKVKVSIFDVADPSKPLELAKEYIQEYWTEVLDNHRAFLKDDRHKIFFLPTGQSGYIFSYMDRKLSLIKKINEQVKRAIYIDNYLYLIGDDRIVVIDEINWQEKKRLDI
ncbi:MAG: hypothetical protein KatS3mg095_0566 [Candidatus Parcubacteria bacterium]|nr:MAG: hypothetical protein KatS3mg095_0566 [Candidatus Parcubacteria bacterium]